MLDPALALGGEIILYPLLPDLAPDLTAIAALIEGSPLPIRALLATHFFGFAKDFSALAELCHRHTITLIEDASHTLFLPQYRPHGIGEQGEFVISSPYKFLPIADGGLLYARDAERLRKVCLQQPRWREELLQSGRLVEETLARRVAAAGERRLSAELEGIARLPAPPLREHRLPLQISRDYHDAEQSLSALRSSRWLTSLADVSAITTCRRRHYLAWRDLCQNQPHCQALFPNLPTDVIPYMFPLVLARPHPHFIWLKRLGVPIYRWDSLAISNCRVAQQYRLHLIHLPCHQSLAACDLKWMTDAIRLLGSFD